jgi:rRNA biogenesis protein RRP5
MKKSFADNCLVLCSVQDVLHDELVVTLPGINNFGYIKSTSISREYTAYLCEAANANAKTATGSAITLPYLYNTGNILRCKVIEYRNKRLYLTCEPSAINGALKLDDLYEKMIISGSVKSKEDHGYIIDLGL